jgi:hypothetical protein
MDDPLAFAAPGSQLLEAKSKTPARVALPRMFLMAITPKTKFNSRTFTRPASPSDFLVHCLFHERACRIRSFCSHSNGRLLRIGTTTPYLHPPVRILLPSRLGLRLPARRLAIRTGRTGVVGYCSRKVVVRWDTENPSPRVDERNRDFSPSERSLSKHP